MTTRRDFLKSSAMGAGALAMPAGLFAEPDQGNIPKRFIFIRKSSGIRPIEIALRDFSEKDKALDEKKKPVEVDLDKHELPKWLRGLDVHKEHMTILQGLSAKMSENVHWSFSSVMGCFKSNRNTLSAIKRTTIDFELASSFPRRLGTLSCPLRVVGRASSTATRRQRRRRAITATPILIRRERNCSSQSLIRKQSIRTTTCCRFYRAEKASKTAS